MCTAVCLRRKGCYFGRNLDVDFSFHESVIITPQGYPFRLRCGRDWHTRLALIGMGTVMKGYPLYYEAANETGLAMAGLNFPRLAVYGGGGSASDSITPFELIPWILGQADSLGRARELLGRLALSALPFSPELPLSPLHFILTDRVRSLVVEPMADGLHISENPYDVLTNAPPFDFHCWNLQQYRRLSRENGAATFDPEAALPAFAAGMGAVGLPGDCSSASRFVRAAYHLANSRCEEDEASCVSQFFHVLDAVAMPRGSVITDAGKNDLTLYSCCISLDQGVYYYKTYGNSQLTAVRLTPEAARARQLTVFDLRRDQQLCREN